MGITGEIFIDLFSALGFQPMLLKLLAREQGFDIIALLDLIILPLLGLFIFYKFWDPIQSPRIKYLLTLLIISLISFVVVSFVGFNNHGIVQRAHNHDRVGEMYTFILLLSVAWFIICLIWSFFLSFFIKRISSSNPSNPF